MSVEATAVAIYPHLLPGHPWPTLEAFIEQIGTEDADGDGDVCLKQTWGDALNPKSHWYLLGMELLGEPVVASMVRDNKP